MTKGDNISRLEAEGEIHYRKSTQTEEQQKQNYYKKKTKGRNRQRKDGLA
jgi:hypothetical protein